MTFYKFPLDRIVLLESFLLERLDCIVIQDYSSGRKYVNSLFSCFFSEILYRMGMWSI